MKWLTTLEAIDTETGEVLNGNAKEIKKKYIITRKEEKRWTISPKSSAILIYRRHLKWLCKPKNTQLKMNI